MNYLIAILFGVLGGAAAYVTLNEKVFVKIPFLRAKKNSNKDSTEFSETEEIMDSEEGTEYSSKYNWVAGVLIAALSGVCAWQIFSHATNPLFVIKLLTALICLIGSGCVDFREKRIPNFFPAVMAIAGIVALAVMYFMDPDNATPFVVSTLISTVICAAAMLFISVVSKSGIGAGDIKLLCSLTLITGMRAVCGTVFFAAITCALAAFVLLLTKKKTIKQSIPFGPFILIGYMVSIILSNY